MRRKANTLRALHLELFTKSLRIDVCYCEERLALLGNLMFIEK